MRKINSYGFIHIHTIVTVILVLLTIGGIGAYVYSKSNATTSLQDSNRAKCVFQTNNLPAKGKSTYYTIKYINNYSTALNDAVIKIGMRNSTSGSIIDEIKYGNIGPKQSKTMSKDIVFPYGSSLSEIYFIAKTGNSDKIECAKSYTVN